MADKYRTLTVDFSTLASTVESMKLKEGAFDVHVIKQSGRPLQAIILAYNSKPVIVDQSGTTSFVTGTAAPDWNTYITYSDVDSDETTLVIDDSAVDMITVGTFDVTWTVTDEWGDTAVLTKEITITAT